MSQPPQIKRQPSADPGPSKSKKARTAVPPLPVLLSIPESKMYANLVELEGNLDWTIARKHNEIMDATSKPVKLPRTLRVFVSNTAAFQPWQQPPTPEGAAPEEMPKEKGEPSWVLRIEGRLIDTGNVRIDKVKRKFSSFIKSMVVEMEGRSPEEGSNVIEWKNTPSTPLQDGFTIQRTGSTDVPLRIILHLEHQPPRFKVAPELASVIACSEDTRANILAALWAYIKVNGLQDKEDRRKVNLDARLKRFLGGVDSIPIHHLPEFINRNVTVPDPVIIHYTVKTSVDRHVHPTCWDIELEMEDPAKKGLNVALQLFAEEGAKDIAALEEEISNLSIALRNARTKRDFLQSFADDPSAFIHRWLASQSRDLALALGTTEHSGIANSGLSPEDLRRSDVFRLPWAEEATIVYEGARAIEVLARQAQQQQAPDSRSQQQHR